MKNQKGSAVLVLLGFILCLSFVGWSGLRVYKSIIFNIEVGGHLKRAADANTIELAKEEMEIVVSYLEKSGMKSGRAIRMVVQIITDHFSKFISSVEKKDGSGWDLFDFNFFISR